MNTPAHRMHVLAVRVVLLPARAPARPLCATVVHLEVVKVPQRDAADVFVAYGNVDVGTNDLSLILERPVVDMCACSHARVRRRKHDEPNKTLVCERGGVSTHTHVNVCACVHACLCDRCMYVKNKPCAKRGAHHLASVALSLHSKIPPAPVSEMTIGFPYVPLALPARTPLAAFVHDEYGAVTSPSWLYLSISVGGGQRTHAA